jgi:hypothetical protein
MNSKFNLTLQKYLKENNPNIADELKKFQKNVTAAPQLQQKMAGAAVEGMSDALSKVDPKLLEIANSIKDKILNKQELTPDELEVLQSISSKNKETEENKTENQQTNQQQTQTNQQQQQQKPQTNQQQTQQNSITYNPNK